MKRNPAYLYIMAFLLGITCITGIWIGNPKEVSILTQEDGVIENLSAIFYFLGIICCLVAIFKRKFVMFSCLWLFFCMIFLGEETSWFQRYLDYSVSVVENINTQSEFNIHNLNMMHGGQLIDKQGHFQVNFQKIFTSQSLFRMGLFVYFLILPIAFLNGNAKTFMVRIGYPNPHALFIIAMWTSIALSFIFALFSSLQIKNALAETREMLYAFFIFLYVFTFVVPNK